MLTTTLLLIALFLMLALSLLRRESATPETPQTIEGMIEIDPRFGREPKQRHFRPHFRIPRLTIIRQGTFFVTIGIPA